MFRAVFRAEYASQEVTGIIPVSLSDRNLFLSPDTLHEGKVYIFIRTISVDDGGSSIARYGHSYTTLQTRYNLQISSIKVSSQGAAVTTSTPFTDAMTIEATMIDPNDVKSDAYTFEFYYRFSARTVCSTTDTSDAGGLFIPLGKTDSARVSGVYFGGPGCVDIRVCVEDRLFTNQRTCALYQEFETVSASDSQAATACDLQAILADILALTSVNFYPTIITFSQFASEDTSADMDEPCKDAFFEFVEEVVLSTNNGSVTSSAGSNDDVNLMGVGALMALIQSATLIMDAQGECTSTLNIGNLVDGAVQTAQSHGLLLGFNRYDTISAIFASSFRHVVITPTDGTMASSSSFAR